MASIGSTPQYDNMLNCSWSISPPGLHYTVATFSSLFEIEQGGETGPGLSVHYIHSGENCRYDSVEVVETRSNQSRYVERTRQALSRQLIGELTGTLSVWIGSPVTHESIGLLTLMDISDQRETEAPVG